MLAAEDCAGCGHCDGTWEREHPDPGHDWVDISAFGDPWRTMLCKAEHACGQTLTKPWE